MFKLKEKNNLEYLWVCAKLGIGVFAYRLALDVIGNGLTLLVMAIQMVSPMDADTIAIINYCIQIVYSVFAFVFGAAIVLLLLNIGKKRNFRPMYMGFGKPLLAPFFIVATVGMNFAISRLNQMFMSLISSDSLGAINELLGVGTRQMGIAEIILLFISTAIIPAIVEELMFRGIVLANLIPYGRGMAIITSALLFGLMHKNPQQFFYATIMGVAIGLVYVMTRSIWICMITHFLNNGLAVLQAVMYGRMEAEVADKLSAMMDITMVILAAVSLAILLGVYAFKRKNAPEEGGSFGRIYEPSYSYEERRVSRGGKVLLFFNPSTSAFTLWTLSSMVGAMGAMVVLGIIMGFLMGGVLI